MAFKIEHTITHKRPAFIRIGGRMVRSTKGREVSLSSKAKGDSLAKFPKTIGAIGWHKWA